MDLNKLLSYSVDSGASDLHLSVGSIPMVRINGTMKPLNMEALKQEDMESILPQVLDEDQMKLFEDNKETNSGGDWHRDGDVKQLKAMLYLSDVNNQNGPFCFIKGSKEFDFERRNKKYPFFRKILFILKGLPLRQPRYKNENIMREPEIDKKITKITGNAGTVVIFDGSYIHRGDVIKSGNRYSLTNYYYPSSKKGITNSIKNILKKLYIKKN